MTYTETVQEVEELYISFFNDFLTVEYFAEYHNITIKRASRIIEIGRKINHKR